MGLFDFLRKRHPAKQSTDDASDADDAMAQLLPGGKPQLAMGAAKLEGIAAGSLSSDEARSLYVAMLYLHVFAEDRSRERLLWSLRQKTNGELTHGQMERILSFLKAELTKYKIALPAVSSSEQTVTRPAEGRPPPAPTAPSNPEPESTAIAINSADAGTTIFLEREGRLRKIDKALFSSLLLIASTSGWPGSPSLLRGGRLQLEDGSGLTDDEAQQLGVALRIAAAKHSPTRSNDPVSNEIQQFMDYCAGGALTVRLRLPELDPMEGAKRLIDQAIGTQSVLYRLFTEKLCIPAQNVRRIELTYFSVALLNFFCLSHARFDELKDGLEPFRRGTFELSLRSAGEALSVDQAAFEYSKRYAEYKALLDVMLRRESTQTGNPDVTLLLHLYESVVRESAQARMIEIMAAGPLMWDFAADAINFTHKVFPTKPTQGANAR